MNTKSLKAKFEDDLGRLVDDYLLQGVAPTDIVEILNYEATHDHAERHLELLRDQIRNSDEYSPTVKAVMEKFNAALDERREARRDS